ncbi:MAG: restriction endonuclease subunit R [Symploca sp. SIO2E6]|nr:restriction endonuclease subunit R [Symploca sp. SIO2E6]
MVTTISARDITFEQLENHFGLEEVEDEQFFWEWQGNMPELSDVEKDMLDKLRAGYFNLLKHPPLLENSVKMAIISPLLFLADFYLNPYYIKAEKSIQLEMKDEGVVVDGRIDVLVFKQQFWLTAIEAKQAAYSIEVGMPQILSYMLANPYPDKASFGLITNGGYFLFLKLLNVGKPRYATSNPFDLRRKGSNELYSVLRILKHLAQLF